MSNWTPQHHKLVILFAILIGAIFVAGYFLLSQESRYESQHILETVEASAFEVVKTTTHQDVPTDGVRALYMSSWVAGRNDLRATIIDLINTTDLNAVIIDVKDVTGKVSYKSQHPGVLGFGDVVEDRITDLDAFIDELHNHGIYVIARIAVFQDKFSPHNHPTLAAQYPNGGVWKDRRNLAWFDAGAREVWEYIVDLAEDAYSRGFDEINIDYVRFPSDGDTKNMVLPVTGERNKPEALTEFFQYIDEELRFSRGIPVSADVFGIITTVNHDVGIGQIFENIAPYVDAIAPMIYPSHYPDGFRGYAKPATEPYAIITIATQGALEKMNDLQITDPHALRPWIQDFDLGAKYTAEHVRAQIEALYDLGVYSFYVWDPANTYTEAAYQDLDILRTQ